MKENLKLRMTFPRKLEERQENILIGHTQSLLEHLQEELSRSREKLKRTEFTALRLAFGRHITDGIDSRLEAMTTITESGKPFFWRYFHLNKTGEMEYTLEYPDPALLIGATGIDVLSKFGVARGQLILFYKETVKDMGFTPDEVRFDHQ